MKLLTPKYITENVVKKAARMAIRAVMTDPKSAVKDLVKRFHCHKEFQNTKNVVKLKKNPR